MAAGRKKGGGARTGPGQVSMSKHPSAHVGCANRAWVTTGRTSAARVMRSNRSNSAPPMLCLPTWRTMMSACSTMPGTKRSRICPCARPPRPWSPRRQVRLRGRDVRSAACLPRRHTLKWNAPVSKWRHSFHLAPSDVSRPVRSHFLMSSYAKYLTLCRVGEPAVRPPREREQRRAGRVEVSATFSRPASRAWALLRTDDRAHSVGIKDLQVGHGPQPVAKNAVLAVLGHHDRHQLSRVRVRIQHVRDRPNDRVGGRTRDPVDAAKALWPMHRAPRRCCPRGEALAAWPLAAQRRVRAAVPTCWACTHSASRYNTASASSRPVAWPASASIPSNVTAMAVAGGAEQTRARRTSLTLSLSLSLS